MVERTLAVWLGAFVDELMAQCEELCERLHGSSDGILSLVDVLSRHIDEIENSDSRQAAKSTSTL